MGWDSTGLKPLNPVPGQTEPGWFATLSLIGSTRFVNLPDSFIATRGVRISEPALKIYVIKFGTFPVYWKKR